MFVDYKLAGHMGEGTFSEVLKCQSLLDGKPYACKKMKQKYDKCVLLDQYQELISRIVLSVQDRMYNSYTKHSACGLNSKGSRVEFDSAV